MKSLPIVEIVNNIKEIEVIPKAIDVFSVDDLLDLIPETRLRVGVD